MPLPRLETLALLARVRPPRPFFSLPLKRLGREIDNLRTRRGRERVSLEINRASRVSSFDLLADREERGGGSGCTNERKRVTKEEGGGEKDDV